jgi:DNA-binding CsgD family transcriptional regulator
VDALAVNLEKGVTRSSMINVRTSAPITDDMRERMTALVPHLQRAVVIGRLFSQARQNEQALTQTFDGIEAAVFIVAADGAISFANDPAKKMLEAATVVRRHDNIFHAVAFDADRLLHQVFADAEQGDDSIGVRGVAIPLADASLDRWFAHVLPLTSGRRQQAGNDLTAVAAVFVRKTAPNVPLPLETIAKTFALRPSEIRVLDALTKVQGVREMATLLGISEATVKTHLQSLFRKTGTNRQSALLKLVAGR